MGSIYKCSMDPDEAAILEQLRQKVAEVAGVTLQGNRLTVRWNMDGRLVDAHMIVESVTTPEEARIRSEVADIEHEVWRDHPDEEAEIYKIQEGEYPK